MGDYKSEWSTESKGDFAQSLFEKYVVLIDKKWNYDGGKQI